MKNVILGILVLAFASVSLASEQIKPAEEKGSAQSISYEVSFAEGLSILQPLAVKFELPGGMTFEQASSLFQGLNVSLKPNHPVKDSNGRYVKSPPSFVIRLIFANPELHP